MALPTTKELVPSNESERLRALEMYDLLDTPEDEEFDRLTRIAERELDVDVAAISLIDQDRQWFKSKVGTEHRETDRDNSYCAYTILSDEPLVIEDAEARDDYDSVTIDGKVVRSYAGVPLITDSGHRLGSFCVFSFEPMSFTDANLELLDSLSLQTMSLIENNHKEKQLTYMLEHDSVTGFLNRQALDDGFDEYFDRYRKENTLGLFHIAIERFRRITEVVGLKAGDRVLNIMADRLNEIVGEESMKARILGDEFLVVEPSFETVEDMRERAETINAAIREPVEIDDEEYMFSASIGISHYPNTGDYPEELRRQAQEALKRTSTEQGSNIKSYLDEMERSGKKAKNLELDFKRALLSDDLYLNYQPKVNLEENTVAGVEALIRWNHPEHGFIPPPTIISLAEGLGLMSKLGQWVMQQSCERIGQWNQAYDKELSLGVNVSAIEFLKGEQFVETLDSIVTESDLSHDRLEVEITETEAMDNLDYTMTLLDSLREIDVSVAVDDFGTGRSSLEYLMEFPDPILKIDRTFVDGSTEDDKKEVMVRSMLDMAQELGLRTVAEGVEREEEETFLRERGCDWYQGYYFSKPLDRETFEERYLN